MKITPTNIIQTKQRSKPVDIAIKKLRLILGEEIEVRRPHFSHYQIYLGKELYGKANLNTRTNRFEFV